MQQRMQGSRRVEKRRDEMEKEGEERGEEMGLILEPCGNIIQIHIDFNSGIMEYPINTGTIHMQQRRLKHNFSSLSGALHIYSPFAPKSNDLI